MLHFSDPVVIDSASRLKMKLAAQVRKKRWTSTHCLGRTMLMVKQLMMVTTMGANDDGAEAYNGIDDDSNF